MTPDRSHSDPTAVLLLRYEILLFWRTSWARVFFLFIIKFDEVTYILVGPSTRNSYKMTHEKVKIHQSFLEFAANESGWGCVKGCARSEFFENHPLKGNWLLRTRNNRSPRIFVKKLTFHTFLESFEEIPKFCKFFLNFPWNSAQICHNILIFP